MRAWQAAAAYFVSLFVLAGASAAYSGLSARLCVFIGAGYAVAGVATYAIYVAASGRSDSLHAGIWPIYLLGLGSPDPSITPLDVTCLLVIAAIVLVVGLRRRGAVCLGAIPTRPHPMYDRDLDLFP